MLFIDKVDHVIQEPEELYKIVDSISLADIEPNTFLRIIADDNPQSRAFISNLKKNIQPDPAEESTHPKHARWLTIYQALSIHTGVVDIDTSYGGDTGSALMINKSITLLEEDSSLVSRDCADQVFSNHGYSLDNALMNYAIGETRGSERIASLKKIYDLLLNKINPYENIPNLDQEIIDSIGRIRFQAKVFDLLTNHSEGKKIL